MKNREIIMLIISIAGLIGTVAVLSILISGEKVSDKEIAVSENTTNIDWCKPGSMMNLVSPATNGRQETFVIKDGIVFQGEETCMAVFENKTTYMNIHFNKNYSHLYAIIKGVNGSYAELDIGKMNGS